MLYDRGKVFEPLEKKTKEQNQKRGTEMEKSEKKALMPEINVFQFNYSS